MDLKGFFVVSWFVGVLRRRFFPVSSWSLVIAVFVIFVVSGVLAESTWVLAHKFPSFIFYRLVFVVRVCSADDGVYSVRV